MLKLNSIPHSFLTCKMQLVTFSLLAVIAPVFAGPLATRQTDITPECQALVDAQTPATKDFFRKVCSK